MEDKYKFLSFREALIEAFKNLTIEDCINYYKNNDFDIVIDNGFVVDLKRREKVVEDESN